jgi:sulfate adenylyltransferase
VTQDPGESTPEELIGRLAPWHPPLAELELVELVLGGALSELPRPLAVPAETVGPAGEAGGVLVEDAEGTPVAALLPPEFRRVRALRPFAHGPLRRHRRPPEQVRTELAALGGGPVLAVPVAGPVGTDAVAAIVRQARRQDARLLVLVLVGAGWTGELPPQALLRAATSLAEECARQQVGTVTVPVAVPAPPHADGALLVEVARANGADLLLPEPARPGPEDPVHPAWARELDRLRRPPDRRGVTLFFTGLSGSGKSTVARAVVDRLLDDGERTVSMLDGDEVRRLLSSGLGFGRADRDLNIRRIGFVAREVTRHGGIAVCAPIAPFAEVRAEVRAMVSEVGDFVLVHVSTPLAECERRDRKGLYARARRGEIPEFTGISSPYQEPDDADLRIDTSAVSLAEAADRIWTVLVERGYVRSDDRDVTDAAPC